MPLRPPGPKPHFLIGNMPLASPDPLGVLTRWAKEYGDIFYYRAGWIHVYFINRPDLVDFVLVRNSSNLRKDKVIQNSRWFFGNGLLTSEGEEWKRQRRLTQPAFHRDKVASYAGLMTGYTEQMLSGWRDGAVLDVHQEMMNLTLRIAVRTLFGLEVEDAEEMSTALNTMMRNTAGIRLLLPPFARKLPLPGMAGVRKAVKQLNDTVSGIIETRRRSRQDSGDLLSILLSVRDEDGSAMSDRQVRDEVLTFLLAGHETTALALSWTWYLLSQNAEATDKLFAEIRTVLGSRVATVSDLPALIYADRVIKESMRLYPPAWSLAREVVNAFDVDGYRIPAGANVVMSQWILHRDARFFDDPLQFDPDRWGTQACARLPRFAYFPFGGGPRQCIGGGFATMEAVLLLATIAARVDLELIADHPVVPVPSFTLRPKYGIRMRLHRR
jgi:cytochrome P450